jgi:hypothetical protein
MIVRDLRLGSKAIIRIYRNGVIIWEGGRVYTAAQLISVLTGFALVDTDYPVHIRMPTDGQLGVTGTPNAQNVDNLIVATGEFGSNVTVESADGINTTGTAEMKLAVCGRPTNSSIVFSRATDKWALGLLGSADPADTVESSGETTASIGTQAMPAEQEMTTMLFSTKGELNGSATHENADVAKQVSSYASGELALIGQPVVKNVYEATFVVNGNVEHQTSVLEGEAPSDPVTDGTIDTPTQESTAQYHFHYAGWSKTEDGEPVGGGSGETDILEETTYEGFEDGAYFISPAPFVLTEGKTYQVIWDGTEHTCVCIIDPDTGLPAISDVVLDENYSPTNGTFAIAYASPEFTGAEDDAIMMIAYDLSSEDILDFVNTSHTVAIYQQSASGGEGLPVITEDTTFYAVYDKELRYYTIDFYDGETSYESKSVAYGDVPSVADPEKDGYTFDGWLPEIVAVTGDAQYYAAWTDMSGYVAYGTCGDDAKWTMDGDGTLTISGTGKTYDVGYAAQPWKSYKSQILAVDVKEGITGIGKQLFYQHANLASVSLPDSLTAIYSYAFFQCTKLTSITIPANVTWIEYWAFQNSGLTSAIFEQTNGWKITEAYVTGKHSSDSTVVVSNASTAATYLKTTYYSRCFYRT